MNKRTGVTHISGSLHFRLRALLLKYCNSLLTHAQWYLRTSDSCLAQHPFPTP